MVRLIRHSRVDQNGCWVWFGRKDRQGYGQGNDRVGPGRTKNFYAHRRAYELFVGPFDPALCVLHRCDNPPCINPDHLFLGTDMDNVQDMIRKGRVCAKLNADLVREIRASKESGASIARRLGINTSTVNHARNRTSWKGVA